MIWTRKFCAPPDHPARQVFRQHLERRYKTIGDLNNSWGIYFTGWDSFLKNKTEIGKAKEDLQQFVQFLAMEYYRKCRDAIRNKAPNKLYLGSRLDFHWYPVNTNLTGSFQLHQNIVM